jgi:60 kDa SS-A/Ro ribonucleoprotein
MGGGGTNCSAPLEWLVQSKLHADVVILISDNQSWVDARAYGPTETLRKWAAFRSRNPGAKLVCIDLQPLGTTQAAEQEGVLNVGGFSDEVFEVVSRFTHGLLGADHWVGKVEAIEL